MATAAELYELVDPVRVENARYELVDVGGAVEGELHPDTASYPTLGVDIGNDVKRTLTGVGLSFAEVLGDTDHVAIDPMKHRVQMRWELPDATDEKSRPSGLFVFANLVEQYGGYSANLHDLGSLFRFERGEAFGIDTAETWTDGLARLVRELPIPGIAIEASSQRPLSPYTQGSSTSRTKIIDDICAALGYWWSFDPVGVFTAAPARDPRSVEADFEYAIPGADRSRVYAESVSRTNDLLDAHNVYKVVSAGTNQAPVTGVYTIPDAAPHSITKRGITVPKTVQVQGIDSQGAADFWAFALSITDDQAYEFIEFDAPWDARLDHYNVVDYAADRTLCLAWSGPARPGGPMRVKLARHLWP